MSRRLGIKIEEKLERINIAESVMKIENKVKKHGTLKCN
jgi:hypothetical protein